MELKFIYPRWGSAHIPWPEFLKKVKENGYAGVEIDLPLGKEKQEIISLLKEFELDFVGQHWETKTTDFEKHKEQYKRHLYNLAEGEPLLINSHTGMDFFSFEQNAGLIELAFAIEKETGITITHETHRSRFSFAAHICQRFLERFPKLKLTSDFSHWCSVAESLLENQQDAVDLGIKHTYHVHARVGSGQSPQVIDPRSDTYSNELVTFKKWWKRMILNAKQQGRDFITITPEYGPEPYALLHPTTKKVLADQWEVNQFIKEEIVKNWT
ncbi:sugar phosphate isomerase/epimerase family protein [Flagellimonas sp. 2504JD1-5]